MSGNSQQQQDDGPTFDYTRWNALASRALSWSVPDWNYLSVPKSIGLEEVWESLTAILFVRIVALDAPVGTFGDLSTSTICRSLLLMQSSSSTEDDEEDGRAVMCPNMTDRVLDSLSMFVRRLVPDNDDNNTDNAAGDDYGTPNNKNEVTTGNAEQKCCVLPYHSPRRVLQVVLNSNKLIELMLGNRAALRHTTGTAHSPQQQQFPGTTTFGLSADPLALLSLMMAALLSHAPTTIYGYSINNAQLVREQHEWALRYNDTNVLQHQALHVAFSLLLQQDELQALRQCLFGNNNKNNDDSDDSDDKNEDAKNCSGGSKDKAEADDNNSNENVIKNSSEYRYFRQLVVSLVLGTDMECPMRTEIFYSKWKETFSKTAKQQEQEQQQQQQQYCTGGGGGAAQQQRRSSLASNISMPRAVQHYQQPSRSSYERRGSMNSIMSDVTIDSYDFDQQKKRVHQHNARFRRRQSNQSDGNWSYYSDYANDSVMLNHHRDNGNNNTGHNNNNNNNRTTRLGPSRTRSNEDFDSVFGDDDVDDDYDDYAADSVYLPPQAAGMRRRKMSMDDSIETPQPPTSSMINNLNAGSVHTRNSSTRLQGASTPQSSQTKVSEVSFPSLAADSIALARRRHSRQQVSEHAQYQQFPVLPIPARTAQALEESLALPSMENAKKPCRADSVEEASSVDGQGSTATDDISASAAVRAMYRDNAAIAGAELDSNESDDDEDSFTLTPPSSEDEMDGVVISRVTRHAAAATSPNNRAATATATPTSNMYQSSSSLGLQPPQQRGVMASKSSEDMWGYNTTMTTSKQNIGFNNRQHRNSNPRIQTGGTSPSNTRRMGRRASTGNYSVKFAGPSLQGSRIDEEGHPQHDDPYKYNTDCNDYSYNSNNLLSASQHSYQQRHVSSPQRSTSFKRLSIRRSIDFSGESLELYSRPSSMSETGGDGTADSKMIMPLDLPDELKASVVLELFLRAACVGHYLQSWDNLVDWTECWYREAAWVHEQGRGPDPAHKWFDGQLTLMEQYVLPLTMKIRDSGVLQLPQLQGDAANKKGMLVEGLELNRDQWLVDGFDVSQSFLKDQK